MGPHQHREPLRVVFYSHDSQGLGHFRRNRVLAHALAQRFPVLTGRGVTGLLINGVGGTSGATLPRGFDVVTLPGIDKSSNGYRPRHLGIEMDGITLLRGDIVTATVTAFNPDLVVVDRHAFGMDGELLSALTELRTHHPRTKIVLGLREVLDAPEVLAAEWDRTPVAQIRDLYDQIWVYGDPTVHDLRISGELPAELHDRVTYLGYLAHGRAQDPSSIEPHRPYVVTTAGGGSDGFALCRTAAQADAPRGHHHLIITGPQMSDAEHRTVLREAGRRTRVVRSVPDAAGLIRESAATVSMAGYNTVTETMATDVAALFVPRETPRTEQLIRAESLQRVGAAELLRQRDLTPAALTAWWSGAVRRRVSREQFNLSGLTAFARAAAVLTSPAPEPVLIRPEEPYHVAV